VEEKGTNICSGRGNLLEGKGGMGIGFGSSVMSLRSGGGKMHRSRGDREVGGIVTVRENEPILIQKGWDFYQEGW